jgi:hypothetical protein
MEDFRSSSLAVDFDSIVRPEDRARWMALPDFVTVRGREVPIDYDVEDIDGARRGVARLRLPEKLARTLAEEEIPALDRPVRFTVLRGPRGAVRAASLGELQEILDRPWSPNEVVEDERPVDLTPREERRVRDLAGDVRRNRRGHRDQRSDRGRRGGPRARSPGDGDRPGRGPKRGGGPRRGRRR